MNLSSGMGGLSGSSSVGGRTHRRNAGPKCKCGLSSVVYTSRTPRNPDRGFFGCIKFRENKPYCDFFRWVDDDCNDTIDLEDWRLNKLELHVAEMEFKLNYVDMKVNEDLQMKVNDQEMKLREQQLKICELSMKMVAELNSKENEIRMVGWWARVLGATSIVLLMICIYIGSRVPRQL